MINLYNKDCMLALKEFKDNQFGLAIVDPPYGLGDRLVDGGTKKNPMQKYRKDYEKKRWDTLPISEYWEELFRVSKNQIVWGGNYFLDYLGSTRGIICWDKKQMMPTLSRWEFAWTSFDKVAKTFEVRSQNINRIHINEKPIKLYEWLLMNYAKEGDKILDTHLGSGSIAIACYNLGYDLEGYELDKEYFEAAKKRLHQHQSQIRMF